MKDFNEFFDTDEEDNFILKKNINLDEDTRQKLLSNMLEIQKNMATEFVEGKNDNDNKNKNDN